MPSFDIVSEFDRHEAQNAVDQANREVQGRFDFRGVDAGFELSDESVALHAEVDFQLKQMLDIGAQTILVPMIESVQQAEEVIRSMYYPPDGLRGVGAALARASGYGSVGDYLQTANDEVCLILQIESRAGLEALDGILELDGVHGVFVGPADLAADMGHRGDPGQDR